MRHHTLALVAAALSAGCFDPVHDERVEALGPEAPGVDQGPLHRPGQPCTVCHGGKGPGSPTFDLAGTVFERADALDPLVGATVRIVDGQGRSLVVGTNEAGNFWVAESELRLGFPLWVTLEFGEELVEMRTPIFRARSCAECHADPASSSSAGHVYLRAQP
ncbi:MAG TPA: hypothetical protein VI072_34000 [Polyangiaceae bacterium]